jgi:2'-5' RNA ligase
MSQHLLVHPYGTWIAAYPTEFHVNKLQIIQEEFKIPNPVNVNRLHCTLMVSRFPKLDAMIVNESQQEYINADIKRLEIWTINKFNNLVLILKSDRLNELNSKYHLDYEVDKKNDFIPHITLSYNVGDFVPPEIDKRLKIVFDCIKAMPI